MGVVGEKRMHLKDRGYDRIISSHHDVRMKNGWVVGEFYDAN